MYENDVIVKGKIIGFKFFNLYVDLTCVPCLTAVQRLLLLYHQLVTYSCESRSQEYYQDREW